MTSNTYTGGGRRVRPDSYYFEKLPRRMRDALNASAFEWDSKWFYDRWNKGRSVDSLILDLEKYNLLECKKPSNPKVKRFYNGNNPTLISGVGPLRIK